MIVTNIIEVTKAKSRVFLDEEFAFVLYKGELRLYHIKKDNEITDTSYAEIMDVVLPKRAKKRCLMLLQKKDYTEEELRRKLKAGEYPQKAIEEAIAYVKSFHYIDDYRYCVSYINCYASKWSYQQIMSKLITKGVDKKCIQQAYEEVMENGNIVAEEELIRAILRKKNYDSEHADAKAKQKIYNHLLYKGFSSGVINQVLKTEFETGMS